MSTENVMSDFDAHAGLYFKDVEARGPNGYGNPFLRSELAKKGVGLYVVSGADSFDFINQSVRAHPTTTGAEGEILLGAAIELPMSGAGSLDILRARVLTPSRLEDNTTVLNGPRLRSLGASKWGQHQLAPDVTPKTVSLEQGLRPTAELYAELEGDTLVVKADMSQDMQYIRVVGRSDVIPAIMGMREEFCLSEIRGKTRKNHRILVQEHAPGEEWTGIVPVDEVSANHLKAADSTELRVYCFVDSEGHIDEESRYYVTARAFYDGKDEWASIEQSSVPDEVWRLASIVSDRVVKQVKVAGGFFAIDVINMPTSQGDDRAMVREINTRDPMMLVESQNRDDARNQRTLLANAMATIARNRA